RKIFCKGFDVWWGQPTFAKKYPRRQDEKTVSGHCLHTSQSRIFLVSLLQCASATPCRHPILPLLHLHFHLRKSSQMDTFIYKMWAFLP
ncbi:MAG: hypothetical protein KHX53_13480, partial [Bacteroides sp.]|nr:hypothetical protein [Bacteroides sp.]